MLTHSRSTTRQAVVAFVVLRNKKKESVSPEEAVARLRAHVADRIGAIARPRTVVLVDELPKTRSGKIMRRLLRDVAEGREVGDTTTLADSAVMNVITAEMR